MRRAKNGGDPRRLAAHAASIATPSMRERRSKL